MGLGDRSELCDGDDGFIEQVLPDSVIADIKAGKTWLPSPPCSAPATPQFLQREENLRYNFPKYIAAGARIVLGTDAGVSAKYSYGFAEHHEIGMYVRLGLTPAEAIIASTSRPTESAPDQRHRRARQGQARRFHCAECESAGEHPQYARRSIVSTWTARGWIAKRSRAKFKQAVVDRDATKARVQKDYVPHPPSSRKLID